MCVRSRRVLGVEIRYAIAREFSQQDIGKSGVSKAVSVGQGSCESGGRPELKIIEFKTSVYYGGDRSLDYCQLVPSFPILSDNSRKLQIRKVLLFVISVSHGLTFPTVFFPVPPFASPAMITLRRMKALVMGENSDADYLRDVLEASSIPITEVDCRTCPEPCDEGQPRVFLDFSLCSDILNSRTRQLPRTIRCGQRKSDAGLRQALLSPGILLSFVAIAPPFSLHFCRLLSRLARLIGTEKLPTRVAV